MRPPFSISIPKLASLANPDSIKTQQMILADPARLIAYLVSCLRILPSLFARLVRTASKSMRWRKEFAAKIAHLINI